MKFTTDKGTFLIVPIPSIDTDEIIDKLYMADSCLMASTVSGNRFIIKYLPEGNYTIIGLSHELSEEQCQSIVDDRKEENIFDDGSLYLYFDYNNYDKEYFNTARESLDSLLKGKKGIVIKVGK